MNKGDIVNWNDIITNAQSPLEYESSKLLRDVVIVNQNKTAYCHECSELIPVKAKKRYVKSICDGELSHANYCEKCCRELLSAYDSYYQSIGDKYRVIEMCGE